MSGDSQATESVDILHQRRIGEQLDAAEKNLADAEEKFGRQSAELVPVINKLAEAYHCDGLYAKAELLYRRSIDILTAAGDQSSNFVEALFKLGTLYRTEGKLDDAESVYLRALALCEGKQGTAEEQRTHAERLCCLAGLYLEKREFAQSEQLLLKAGALFTDVFGENNYFSRLCSLGLAVVFKKQGKGGVADEHAALAAYKQTATTATDKVNHSDERAIIELARLYYAQGRIAEVEQLIFPVLLTDEEKIWPDHPRVGQFFHERGELFRAQGLFEQAEKCLHRGLEIRMATLGNAHAEVGMTAMCLACMLLQQNRYADAEPILKLAIKTRVRAFGVEHPSVAASIETYALLLKKTKRVPIAQKLDARARDIRTKLVWQSERGSAGRAK